MKIILADVLGFCFGVRRAVLLAQKALQENSTGIVYSLGPLIHNETVLEQLEKQGLKILQENEIQKVTQQDTVIIRAHGVPPQILQNLEKSKCTIIDATCTKVKASQKMVSALNAKDDYILFCGDKDHGEVRSIEGYANNNFRLIQNISDVQKILEEDLLNKNVTLMSQTTFSYEDFIQIENQLKNKNINLCVKNTICPATNERQQSLINLCKKVDGVLVIGGKQSANSKRLYEIAKENCKNACLIQSKSDIPKDFFSLNTVGITAGASTPDSIISDIEKSL